MHGIAANIDRGFSLSNKKQWFKQQQMAFFDEEKRRIDTCTIGTNGKMGFQGIYVCVLLLMILCWGPMFHPRF